VGSTDVFTIIRRAQQVGPPLGSNLRPGPVDLSAAILVKTVLFDVPHDTNDLAPAVVIAAKSQTLANHFVQGSIRKTSGSQLFVHNHDQRCSLAVVHGEQAAFK
jgi:hypothetical protein